MRTQRLERAEGAVFVTVGRGADDRPRLRRLRHSGAAKCLLPRTHDRAPLGVLVNTAGGLAGGDRFDMRVEVDDGAAMVVTSQAAERVYRAAGPEETAMIANQLTLGPAAQLSWLPQETIMFDGGRLRRRLEIEMAEDARLLAFEMVTLGRRAMGETVRDGFLSDKWRVRRGGRLVFADAVRLDAPIDARLAPLAAGGGARAFATLLYAAPDAADRLEAARARLVNHMTHCDISGLDAGASAWDGLLVLRMVAPDPAPLRRLSADLIAHLGGAEPPKFWSF